MSFQQFSTKIPYIVICSSNLQYLRNLTLNILLAFNLKYGTIVCASDYNIMFNKYIDPSQFYNEISTSYVSNLLWFKRNHFRQFNKQLLTFQIWNNYTFTNETYKLAEPLLRYQEKLGIINIVICHNKMQYDLHKQFATDIVFDNKFAIKPMTEIVNRLSTYYISFERLLGRLRYRNGKKAMIIGLRHKLIGELNTKIPSRKHVKNALSIKSYIERQRIQHFNRCIKDELYDVVHQLSYVYKFGTIM